MDLLAEPAARSILEQGRHLYVAVAAAAGPHVTPELYSVADGRIWFWSAHTTVKAKVLADDRRAAAVVTAGSRSVVVTGRAERFDPRDLGAVRRMLADPKAIGRATLRFGLRNAADLGGFAGDLVSGRLGRSIPPRRVLVGIRPTRLAVVDAGQVTLAVGEWADPEARTAPGPVAGVEPAVVAWETDRGPVALPARVDLGARTAWLAPALVDLVGLPSPARVGVVVDDYVAPGPAAKEGTLVRGTATLGEGGKVTLTPERETDWNGIETRTRRRAG